MIEKYSGALRNSFNVALLDIGDQSVQCERAIKTMSWMTPKNDDI